MSDWVTIDSLPHETLAYLWRDRLTQEDIPCQLRGLGLRSTGNTNASWGNPLGGIEVLVRREDAATARRILGLGNSRRVPRSKRWFERFWIRAVAMLCLACSLGLMVSLIALNLKVGAVATLVLFCGLLWWSRPPRDAS